MADAREESVWTKHAIEDHTKIKPYTHCVEIDNLISKMDSKPEIVTDLGCGSGLWRPIFKDMKYIGVDQNEAMIDTALRHFPNCMCYQNPEVPGVMTEIMNQFWDFKDTFFIRRNLRFDLDKVFEVDGRLNARSGEEESWILDVDVVWFSAVIQHNRRSDQEQLMDQVSKILNKGRYLMFTETTFTPDNLPPSHLRFEEGMTDGWSYTRKGWKDFIEPFGFELIENEPFNYFLFRRI